MLPHSFQHGPYSSVRKHMNTESLMNVAVATVEIKKRRRNMVIAK